MAFPRLNLVSWYIYMAGGAIILAALFLGGVDTGWTFYTPFSTMFSNSYVTLTLFGVFVVGFSSIATSVNFITTVHKKRVPGLHWFRLPLFVWAIYATSIILVLATPVLAITMLLATAERLFQIGVFDPAYGGDPILFQHMFWFYSHPAVYIMLLPAMGVVSEVIPCFASKRVFGYRFMTYAILAIAAIGFLVWGHHMFVTGQSVAASLVFSLLSFFVAVPSAIKVFNWTATLYKGRIRFDAPMLYVLGFVGLFTIGGLTGLFLASLALDVHLTDTYFVVAHFHYIMVGGAVMAFFGGLHFWWPKVTGRLVHEVWARIAAVTMFVRLQPHLLPAVPAGRAGHAAALPPIPARVHGAQRHLVGRRQHPGGGLPDAAGLPDLVALQGRTGERQPLGRDRPGMANAFAAAERQLRDAAEGARRRVRLHAQALGGAGRQRPRGAFGMSAAAGAVAAPRPKGGEAAPRRMARDGSAASPPAGDGSGGDATSDDPRESPEHERETAEFGIWVFLASEIMFFGGLFFAYVYGRMSFPDGFAAASRATDVVIGTANTAVLLTSSFFVAVAVVAGSKGRRKVVAPLLAATAALGIAFLVLKGIEYHEDWSDGLFPGPFFHLKDVYGSAVPPGAQLFYMLYFAMTGVHAVHLTIGIAWMGVAALGAHREPDVWCKPNRLEVAGLYWHFVDIIWIFLYPLIYLIGRHG